MGDAVRDKTTHPCLTRAGVPTRQARGVKALSGYDKDEFIILLSNLRDPPSPNLGTAGIKLIYAKGFRHDLRDPEAEAERRTKKGV